MSIKYDGNDYEMLWRPNYEMRTSAAWIGSGVVSLGAGAVSTLPTMPFLYMSALAGGMSLAYMPKAFHIWKMQRYLKGRPLSFMSQKELADKLMDSAKKSGLKRLFRKKTVDPFAIGSMWFGYGFRWEQRHCQRTYEIMKRDWSDFFEDKNDDEHQMGQPWIHGVEPEEGDVDQPLKHSEGHVLIVGTTGSGKTRCFDNLVTQAILRNEPVIIIDPKGDKELRDNMKRACEMAGDPSRYISFHPAFPEESIRIDPLANFTRGTELASRIAELIQTSSGGEVFKDFAQMSLNNLIQGLLITETRPSLINLKRNLENKPSVLILESVRKYILKVDESQLADLENYLANAMHEEKKAKEAIKFYRTRILKNHSNSDLEGLLSMYEHDAAHFGKMITSLLPVMNMLTSGDMGNLLSPDRENFEDDRPIYNTRTMIDNGKACYIGLDSLTDAMVGSAIGSMMLADLAAVAGDRYNFGDKDGQSHVNIFVDEAAEVLNDALLRILNKGRGAKLRLFVATQTIADISAKLGSEDKAMQILGNLNNWIALRTKDPKTQQYLAEDIPETSVKYVMRTQGMSTNATNPALYGGNHGERLMEEKVPLITPQMFGLLPNLEFFTNISGGKIYKGRLPIIQN